MKTIDCVCNCHFSNTGRARDPLCSCCCGATVIGIGVAPYPAAAGYVTAPPVAPLSEFARVIPGLCDRYEPRYLPPFEYRSDLCRRCGWEVAAHYLRCAIPDPNFKDKEAAQADEGNKEGGDDEAD